ncbi:MAG: hypothetical protein V3V08_08230 [Nannocystaceae bacterium]
MPPSPQLGYNHNIPHRGRLYHVQTEDSGAAKGHIFTHVFYDGTIIGSKKVKYDGTAEIERFDAHVVSLMQESHKSMIRDLRRGTFDAKIVAYVGEHPGPPSGDQPSHADNQPATSPEPSTTPGKPEATTPRARTQARSDDAAPLATTSAEDPPHQTVEDTKETIRTQPPAVPPRFGKQRPKRTPPLPPPLPRTPVPKGAPLRTDGIRSGDDPLLSHPSRPQDLPPSPNDVSREDASPSDPSPTDASRSGARPRGRRRARRVLGGIGGRGVSVGTPIEIESRREVVVGKFASEHQVQLDDEILRLLGEDSSSS